MAQGVGALTQVSHKKRSSGLHLLPRVICPHCWHRFPTHEIVWVANHDDLRDDPVVPGDQPLRFRPSRFDVHGEALDARGLPCHVLACPKCHLEIPSIFLEIEPIFFSLIGVLSGGKSYFLAAMVWELRRLLATHFSLSFTDVDTANNQLLNSNVETLFLQRDRDELVSIAKTQLESEFYDQVFLKEQVVRLPRPFSFVLRPTKDHPQFSDAVRFSRILCLYDNAGEHYLPGGDSAKAPGTQHLARARVLMFLYDPTRDPRFRDECRAVSDDPQLFAQDQPILQSTIVTEAASRVRRYSGLSQNAKLKKPLLVLIGKSDVWEKLIDEDITTEPFIEPESDRDGAWRLDFERIERVSVVCRKLLLRITPEFVAAAEEFCDTVYYIPVSAIGGSPRLEEGADGQRALLVRPRDIAPRWVTVPIIFAFGKWATGIIARE